MDLVINSVGEKERLTVPFGLVKRSFFLNKKILRPPIIEVSGYAHLRIR